MTDDRVRIKRPDFDNIDTSNRTQYSLVIDYVIKFLLDSQEESWLYNKTTSISKMKKTGPGYKIGEEEYVLQVECTCCNYSRFYDIENSREAAKCFITRCLECSFKRHVKVVPCDKKRGRSS